MVWCGTVCFGSRWGVTQFGCVHCNSVVYDMVWSVAMRCSDVFNTNQAYFVAMMFVAMLFDCVYCGDGRCDTMQCKSWKLVIVVALFPPSMCSDELFTGSTSIFVYTLVTTFLSLLLLLSTSPPWLSSATTE